MKLETLAIHSGRVADPASGAVISPIVLSTTFARDDQYQMLGADVYGRISNPNRRSLESALAVFEGAADACAFSSGMAAVNAVLQSLKVGDHVILPHDSYFATRALATTHFTRWGLEFDTVDMTDIASTRAALRPNTALVWIEHRRTRR
jgi:cystathionine gamma-synthase